MPITNRRLGQTITTTVLGEAVKAFVPSPLPPEPAIDLSAFYGALDRANQALGRLDGLSTLLPNTNLFLYFYVRKEALLSSQIEGTITEPILYLSLYFKARRQDYYDLLNRVRTHGDWENWISFFLEGVTEVASNATASAKQIIEVFADDTARIQAQGRRASTILRVHSYFQRHPYSNISKASSAIGLSFPATSKAIDSLISLDILKEVSGRARDRIFAYRRYLAILSEGAAPL